jgi:hypothetical protein
MIRMTQQRNPEAWTGFEGESEGDFHNIPVALFIGGGSRSVQRLGVTFFSFHIHVPDGF